MASHQTWDKSCIFWNKSGHTDSFHDLQPTAATSFLFPTFVLSQLSGLIIGLLKFIPALGPLHSFLSLECFFHGFTWLAPSHLSRPGAALSGCLGCAWGANIQSLLMGKGTCPPGGGRSEQPTFPPGQMEGGTAPFQALENPWKFQFSISECKVFLSRGKMKGN